MESNSETLSWLYEEDASIGEGIRTESSSLGFYWNEDGRSRASTAASSVSERLDRTNVPAMPSQRRFLYPGLSVEMQHSNKLESTGLRTQAKPSYAGVSSLPVDMQRSGSVGSVDGSFYWNAKEALIGRRGTTALDDDLDPVPLTEAILLTEPTSPPTSSENSKSSNLDDTFYWNKDALNGRSRGSTVDRTTDPGDSTSVALLAEQHTPLPSSSPGFDQYTKILEARVNSPKFKPPTPSLFAAYAERLKAGNKGYPTGTGTWEPPPGFLAAFALGTDAGGSLRRQLSTDWKMIYGETLGKNWSAILEDQLVEAKHEDERRQDEFMAVDLGGEESNDNPFHDLVGSQGHHSGLNDLGTLESALETQIKEAILEEKEHYPGMDIKNDLETREISVSLYEQSKIDIDEKEHVARKKRIFHHQVLELQSERPMLKFGKSGRTVKRALLKLYIHPRTKVYSIRIFDLKHPLKNKAQEKAWQSYELCRNSMFSKDGAFVVKRLIRGTVPKEYNSYAFCIQVNSAVRFRLVATNEKDFKLWTNFLGRMLKPFHKRKRTRFLSKKK